jgi:hypothetical protein
MNGTKDTVDHRHTQVVLAMANLAGTKRGPKRPRLSRPWPLAAVVCLSFAFARTCVAFSVVTRPQVYQPLESFRLYSDNPPTKGKRKRKRKGGSEAKEISGGGASETDLPDFDLAEASTKQSVSTPSEPKKAPQQAVANNGEPAMASTPAGSIGAKSLKDLLNDRSLESSLLFDEPAPASISEELPDLMTLASSPTRDSPQSFDDQALVPDASEPSLPFQGKKRARREARQQAAQAAEEKDEDDLVSSLLSKLPGIRNEETGQIAPIKILETGTWACIFILLAWELYLNSPLFDRAAPLVPVVY